MDAADELLFREFVAERSPALMRLGYLLTGGDQHAAEDLVQTALAKLAGRWRRVAAPEAYVRQIMYRQQVSWWRARLRRPEVVQPLLPERAARDAHGQSELRLEPLPTRDQSLISRLLRIGGRAFLAPLEAGARQDLGWSLDGELIWSPTKQTPDRVWYTIDGREADAPEGQRYVAHSRHSALSPDGRLLLGRDGLPTKITDVETGKVAGRQRVLRLLAWADDDHAIALGCAGRCENEFDNGLVLVSVDGSEVTRLAAHTDNQQSRPWEWVLTPR